MTYSFCVILMRQVLIATYVIFDIQRHMYNGTFQAVHVSVEGGRKQAENHLFACVSLALQNQFYLLYSHQDNINKMMLQM